MQGVVKRDRSTRHFNGSIVCITDNSVGSVQVAAKIVGFQVHDHAFTR